MVPNQQTQVQITHFSKLPQLDGVEVIKGDVPSPGEGEVLCQIFLRPINPTDVHAVQGLRPIGPHHTPHIAGGEGVAKVVKLGKGVQNLEEGQRVVGVPWTGLYGTWQQYRVMPAESLMPVSDKLSDKVAAQLWVNPMTAKGLVETSKPPEGEYMIQTAAGSTLGRMITSIAKHLGIKIIDVVRRTAQKEELEKLGAAAVIATDKENLIERVKEITGGNGAYAAIDAVGGETTKQVAMALQDGGTVYVYGALSGDPIQVDTLDTLYKYKKVEGWLLGTWLGGLKDFKATIQEVCGYLEDEVIVPDSGDSFPLEKVHEAILETEKTGRKGKVFLEG
ncbi:hypothetical protein WJX79_005785 [Trebouxia sp. C0005]|nr:MAG: hypothetical protein FRX49_01631 [Trebouxia sp. A1-2]